MVIPADFYKSLINSGIGMFAGVPDSLLKDFCAFVADKGTPQSHVITANEGNALALAAGYHLTTGKIAAVYMQNSGLGNTINPLASLTDPAVYRIPLLMIIGWRGEPGIADEPQHVKQGQITEKQLALLGIPCWILDAESDLDTLLPSVFGALKKNNAPVALLVRKNTFQAYESTAPSNETAQMNREEALATILESSRPDDIIISTTGKTSRELFELRKKRGEAQHDFLTVGCMGHTSSIALGAALGNPKRRVLCLDGDGSVLMHLGALPIIGSLKPSNLVHVLLNNSAHDSVGGQPTVAGTMDFDAISKSCGYRSYYLAKDRDLLMRYCSEIREISGPVLLEVSILKGARSDLGRPTSTPEQNKNAFMKHAQA